MFSPFSGEGGTMTELINRPSLRALGNQRHRRSVVTGNIILAYLRSFRILAQPEAAHKRFQWFEPLFDHQDIGHMDVDSSLLYVCSVEDAPTLLARSSLLFAIVLTREDELPEWLEANRNRVILIRCEERYMHLVALIQNLFTSLVVWEYELDYIVTGKETLAELLTEANTMLNGFLCITDGGYNLIARAENARPPCHAYERLVETGCYPPGEIDFIAENVLATAAPGELVFAEPHEGNPYVTLHLPLYNDDSFFFLLTLACESGMGRNAAHDFMSIIASRVSALCNGFWEDKLRVESPWHAVFTKLIEGSPMTESYLTTQLGQTNCLRARQFKLVMLDLGLEDSPVLRDQAIKESRRLNDGHCYPFAYNNALLALMYFEGNEDGHFSTRRVSHDLNEHIFSKYGVRATTSRVFSNIRELKTAYAQAVFTKRVSPILDRERTLAGIEEVECCHSFEHALPYYMIVGDRVNQTLVEFCMRHNILEKISLQDRETGSDLVRLLWTYLCLNCNATAVAKQMHMHRNTVLYHIDKLEKRFDFDLTEAVNRQRLIADFKLYFLSNGFTQGIEFFDMDSIEYVVERDIA